MRGEDQKKYSSGTRKFEVSTCRPTDCAACILYCAGRRVCCTVGHVYGLLVEGALAGFCDQVKRTDQPHQNKVAC